MASCSMIPSRIKTLGAEGVSVMTGTLTHSHALTRALCDCCVCVLNAAMPSAGYLCPSLAA